MDFITPPIPFTDVVYDIEIDQTDIPEIISGVSYVEVASALGVTFRYDRSALPFDHITIAAGTSIDFPDWIIVSDPNGRFNTSGDNVFTLEEDLNVASGMSLEFAIEALDFTKLPENQGFIEKGHLHIDADVHLSGAIILKASECSAAGTYKPVISTYMHMDSMDIRNVRLSKVDLGADAHSSMKVDLKEELPDFLYDSGLTYDFNALTLKVDLYNGLPFAGSLTASIDSYQGEGSPLNHVDLTMPVEYQLDVAGNVRSHYFTDINSLLNPLPEYLMVNTEIVIDDLVDQTERYEDYGLIIPGATYFFDGGYEFIAPLSFGSGFRLELDDEIRNLNLDVTAVDVAEAHLEMNLVNTLPLEIQMSGQAIDAEGNVLEHIAAEFEGTITGGTVDNPSVNAVTVKLTNEGELKLDGVRFRMVARPSGDGVILNRNQYLQLTDIRLSLPQGVTYHVEQ